MELENRERLALERLKRIEEMEQQAKQREKELKTRENAKKQVPLRLSATLYNDLAQWAEEDFRSVNGQIEYLLSEAVRQRKKK